MNIDYIAGFIDGEGSITIRKNRVRITIPQTNFEILDEIRLFFGFGGITTVKKRKEHWKQSWVYYSGSNKNSDKILKLLDGHLILKQKKLEEAKTILKDFFSISRGHANKKEEILRLVDEGKSYRQIEKILKVSRNTVCNFVKQRSKSSQEM